MEDELTEHGRNLVRALREYSVCLFTRVGELPVPEAESQSRLFMMNLLQDTIVEVEALVRMGDELKDLKQALEEGRGQEYVNESKDIPPPAWLVEERDRFRQALALAGLVRGREQGEA